MSASGKTDPGKPRPLAYGRQSIDETDVQAVVETLRGDWLTQGPAVERFEQAIAAEFGVAYAVACSNGTAALHLAAMSLGWGAGDVVLVPAVTFLASANCAAYVGAEPYFVDIDDTSLTVDPNDVEHHVKKLRAAGRRVRAIVGVDMGGHACDWPALRQLADRYDLSLVDDACHAMGGTYDGGVKVGSCAHADVSILSFHPVKHITTGEGGAVLTNDSAVAERAARLRSHGTVRGPERIAEWDGPWHYDMVDLGYNYRLTDLQASLGLSQLKRLHRFVDRRRAIAAAYAERLAARPVVRPPAERPGVRHAYHLYVARVPFDDGPVSRRELFERCRRRGLSLQVHYRPVFMNSYYRDRADNRDAAARMPVSVRYYREAISLPMFPDLTDQDIDRVVDTLEECLRP